MPSDYTTDAYKELIYSHPDWHNTVLDYEIHFAKNLYDSPMVKQTAHDVLVKLSSMLNAYYGLKENGQANPMANQPVEQQADDLNALQTIAATVSGEKPIPTKYLQEGLLIDSNDRSGGGQIGNRLVEENPQTPEAIEAGEQENIQMLDDTINKDGTLREQMTLLYNGMFRNGGRNKQQIANSHSLKNMMVNITPEDVAKMSQIGELAGNEQLRNLSIDFDILNEQDARNNKDDIFDTTRIAIDLKKAVDKKKGRGNKLTRFFAGIGRFFSAHFTSGRSKKSKKEQIGLGEEYYNNLGIPLSEREARFGIQEEKDAQGNVTSRKLLWKEGQAYNKMKKPIDGAGMLAIAGTSGTTLRMLGAYRLMGAKKTDLLYFRLALMAWMVTSQDHSIAEIIRGSHNAGVKGFEDMSEAATMYQTIDPLSTAEIRENYAPNHKFPHEIIYLKMMEDLSRERKTMDTKQNQQIVELYKEKGIDLDEKAKNYHILKDKLIVYGQQLDGLDEQVEEMKAVIDSWPDEPESMNEVYERRAYVDAYNDIVEQRSEIVTGMEEAEAEKNEIGALLETAGYQHEHVDREYALYSPIVYARATESFERLISMETADLDAGDVALDIYTTEAYNVMNKSEKFGRTIGNYALKHGKAPYWNSDQFKNERKNGKLLDRISDMLRLSYRISQDALLERTKVSEEQYNQFMDERGEDAPDYERGVAYQDAHVAYTKPVYRGEIMSGTLGGSVGGEFETKKLTSTTTDFNVGLKFIKDIVERGDAKEDNMCLSEYILNGSGGVLLSSITSMEGEDEVLLPMGLRFRVDHAAEFARGNTETQEVKYESELSPEQLGSSDWDLKFKYVRLVEVPGEHAKKETIRKKKQSKRDAYRAKLMNRANNVQQVQQVS
ncbi:MAG: hypothetical protein PUD20_10240 [bacterium]|nr:hypothetical protein [bacterium]